MSEAIPTISYDEAYRQLKRDIEHLTQYVSRPPAILGTEMARDDHLILAVIEMFKDPENLRRGQIMSRLLRLRDNWRNAVFEYVMQAKFYRDAPLSLSIKVTNFGSTPVSLLVGAHHVHEIKSDGTKSTRYRRVKNFRELAPGASTWVTAEWSGAALDYSWEAQAPDKMVRSQRGRPSDLAVREVDYRAKWVHPLTGEDGEVDSAAWRAEQDAAEESLVGDGSGDPLFDDAPPRRRGRPRKAQAEPTVET